MIAFFAERRFAAASGFPKLPNRLFFSGGHAALDQLGVELPGTIVVLALVFALPVTTAAALARLGDITPEYAPDDRRPRGPISAGVDDQECDRDGRSGDRGLGGSAV